MSEPRRLKCGITGPLEGTKGCAHIHDKLGCRGHCPETTGYVFTFNPSTWACKHTDRYGERTHYSLDGTAYCSQHTAFELASAMYAARLLGAVYREFAA